MKEKTWKDFDWESGERVVRSVCGRMQEKAVFRPEKYDSLEYVVWRNRYRMPALDMPKDHHLFKLHGIENGVRTRVLIEGSIDFINCVGGFDLRIDIDDADDEKNYLMMLLEQLKKAKSVIRSRLDYLAGEDLDKTDSGETT